MVSRRTYLSVAAMLCCLLLLNVFGLYKGYNVRADGNTTVSVGGNGSDNCASFSCTVRASDYSAMDNFELYSVWAYETSGKANVFCEKSGSTAYITVKSKDGSPLSDCEIYVGVSSNSDAAVDLNRVGISYYSEDITTPTPTATSTPTPTPTATSSPTPTPKPTATPTPKATETPVPTATAAPTATPLPTATPEPTAVPDENAGTEDTPTPTPTSTPTPTPTETPTPTPTSTPTPTPVPVTEESVAEALVEETIEETEDPDHIPTKPPTKLGAIMGNNDGEGPGAGSIILGLLKYLIIILAVLIVGRLIYLKLKGTYNEDLLKEFIPFKKKKTEDNPEAQAVNGFLQKSNTQAVRPVYSNAAYEASRNKAEQEKEDE